HIGFFEAAEGGSLFLDEVGEIVITQQSKLLRALQESEYRRVGEQRSRHFHTRIIAATNRSLRNMVDAGSFREDLYYRLNVFPIRMPPLRERMEDIPLLVESFLRSFAKTLHRPGLAMAEGHMEKLMNYSWPGNIRELQNVIHRACILARDGIVRVDVLDAMLVGTRGTPSSAGAERAVQTSPQDPQVPQIANRIYTMEDLKRLEKENLLNAVRRCNGKIFGANGAAALLGLKPTTLIARLEKMGIERRKLDEGR
ncbi:MAG: sigma 54-interacting transcriptional regulator, partial [Desulfovibrio sp.]|nr:sigma 54-interacting transcriptional regulator [Desulfovibrio sp.]